MFHKAKQFRKRLLTKQGITGEKQFQKVFEIGITIMPKLNNNISVICTITRSFHICSH